jgi:hypothetical protein
VSYSHMANATLPSALQRFTSVFGMGTGGSIALLPPGIFGSLIAACVISLSNKSWKAVTSRSLFRSSIKQALQNYLGVVWLSLSGH